MEIKEKHQILYEIQIRCKSVQWAFRLWLNCSIYLYLCLIFMPFPFQRIGKSRSMNVCLIFDLERICVYKSKIHNINKLSSVMKWLFNELAMYGMRQILDEPLMLHSHPLAPIAYSLQFDRSILKQRANISSARPNHTFWKTKISRRNQFELLDQSSIFPCSSGIVFHDMHWKL